MKARSAYANRSANKALLFELAWWALVAFAFATAASAILGAYWALSALLVWGLFANLQTSHSSTLQTGEKGNGGARARRILYITFGGAILPMIVLLGAAVSGLAILGFLTEQILLPKLPPENNPT